MIRGGPGERSGGAPRTWWTATLWGVVTLLVGIFLIVAPGTTARLAVRLLALAWLAGGLADLAAGIETRGMPRWAVRIVSGVVGMLGGILLLANPLLGAGLSVSVQYGVLGATALVIGLLRFAAPGGQHPCAGAAWVMAAVQLALGIFLLATPVEGTMRLLPWLGGGLAAAGVAVCLLAQKARRSV